MPADALESTFSPLEAPGCGLLPCLETLRGADRFALAQVSQEFLPRLAVSVAVSLHEGIIDIDPIPSSLNLPPDVCHA